MSTGMATSCCCQTFSARFLVEDVIYKDLETEVERSQLKRAISKLGERERTIIMLRFGLNNPDDMEMTQKEVADYLGISQSYISRLEKKIMKRLKKEMAS